MNRLILLISRIFFLFCTLAFSTQSFGAACCGGGSNFPALITGDFRSQVSSSFTQGTVVADADPTGLIRNRKENRLEESTTMSVSASYQISDYWQGGITVPLIKKWLSGIGHDSFGVGDISLQGAFEFFPETVYSPWRPRGIVYGKLTIPTAPSVYDSSSAYGTDIRGRGFFTPALGLAFLKIWGPWDAQLMAEVQKSLPRIFQEKKYEPSTGYRAILAGGHSLSNSPWRFGISVSPSYVGSIMVNSLLAQPQWVWESSASVSFMPNADWLFSGTYTDQTWLAASNQPLSQTFSIMAQRRWSL